MAEITDVKSHILSVTMSLIYNVNEKSTVFLGTIEIQAQTTVNVISTEKTVYE